MFSIEFTPESIDDLRSLRSFDRTRIIGDIESQLADLPTTATRRRKLLRPNPFAKWQLRIGQFRVFYDVVETAAESTVRIIAIGHKVGNRLFIRGERFEL